MKLLLSKCKSNKLDNVVKILKEHSYLQIGTSRIEPNFNLEMFLFFENHEKEQISWLFEMLNFFNASKEEYNEHNINKDVLHQYNAIVILKTSSNLYTHSFGQGFRITDKFIDNEFGLEFAEKTIRSEQITLKNVSYIQKNKMKGITNYKKEQGEFPQASESYAFVSGHPDFELFGNSIDCGTGVTFPKNYQINTTEGFYQLSELMSHVDDALKLKENKSLLPRIKKVAKKNKLTEDLDREILLRILKKPEDVSVAIDIGKIHLVNNSIDVYSENNHLELYIVNNIKDTKEEIEPYDDAIVKFINKHKDSIVSLDNIRIRVTNHDNDSITSKSLKDWMYCELEYKGKLYILDSGFWGYFNERFSKLLEQQLNNINRVIDYEEGFNIEYISGKDHLAGEGGYIETLTQDNNLVKLHQRNVLVNGTPIEIADIYRKDTKELIAIKRGMDTSNCMYSFEQSVLSVQLLRNSEDFNVKEELLKYNIKKNYSNRKKYPNVRAKMVNEILDSRLSSILWLHNTNKYVEITKLKQFDFNMIGSMLLKLKIVDWYSFVIENNFIPKVYMGLDLQK